MSHSTPTPVKYFLQQFPEGTQLDFTKYDSESFPLPTPEELYQFNDNGNCSPNIMRAALNTIPRSNTVIARPKLPPTISLSPLAPLAPFQRGVPVLQREPIRCARCRAYLSPHALVDSGSWQCAFCTRRNRMPESHRYMVDLRTSQVRMDLPEGESRLEMLRGTVEYVVKDSIYAPPSLQKEPFGEEYDRIPSFEVPGAMTHVEAVRAGLSHPTRHREPTVQSKRETSLPTLPFVHLLLVPISSDSMTLGLWRAAVAGLKSSLASMPDSARVCLVLYSDGLYFLTPRSELFMPAETAPMLPLPPSAYPLLGEGGREELMAVIERLETRGLPHQVRPTRNALGVALQGAVSSLSGCGGRVTCLVVESPSWGKGALPPEPFPYGIDREMEMLTPQAWWQQLGDEAAGHQVCVDIIAYKMAENKSMRLASLGYLPQVTGGDLTLVPAAPGGLDRVASLIVRVLTREQGLAGTLVVRTSEGIRATNFIGALTAYPSGEVNLAGVDEDKSVSFDLAWEDKISSSHHTSYIQAALLYTHPDGSRRVRVHSGSLKLEDKLASVYNRSDMPAVISAIARRSVTDHLVAPVEGRRLRLMDSLVTPLTVFRQICSSSSAGRLVVPQTLQLAPLHVSCLLKTPALAKYPSTVRTDERVASMFKLRTLSPSKLCRLMYPLVLDLSPVEEHSEVGTVSKSGLLRLPSPERAASRYLSALSSSILLLCDGEVCYLWVGQRVAEDKLVHSFGVSTFQEVPEGVFLGSDDAPRVRAVCSYVPQLLGACRCIVSKEGGDLDKIVRAMLTEDAANGEPAHMEFLSTTHKAVCARVME